MNKKKYFGTDGIRGTSNSAKMNADIAMKLGMAAGVYFKKEHSSNRVVIGKDTRLSGYMIENAIVSGLLAVGMDVFLLGPMPTPAVSMLTRSLRADLGIMISASHNSYEDNGIKLFNPQGLKLSDEDEIEIESLLEADLSKFWADSTQIGRAKRVDDEIGRYVEYVKSTFPKHLSLEGFKIVIDCANGAGYKVGPKLLWELGAEVIAINISPDGYNINSNCGSNHPEILSKEVIAHKANIGIALDGDADRILICDQNGQIIDGEHIIAAIALHLKNNNQLSNNLLTTTIMASMSFDNFMNQHNIKVHRTQVGDRYVAEDMRKNNINLGGETSGHIIIGEYSSTGDSLVSALQILAYLAENNKQTSDLSALFTPFPRIIKNLRYTKYVEMDNENIKKIIANAEKKLLDKGRLLIRKSGTEPLIRILIEGKEHSYINIIANELFNDLEEIIS